MKEIIKKYTNGEVTVVWKPGICIHSTICFNGLPEVFHPSRRPWVTPEDSTTEKVINQVKQCPSGALTFYMNSEAPKDEDVQAESRVEVIKNGPLLVYGNITIRDHNGNETHKTRVTAFCRCGESRNKPYCDGAHIKSGFQG